MMLLFALLDCGSLAGHIEIIVLGKGIYITIVHSVVFLTRHRWQ